MTKEATRNTLIQDLGPNDETKVCLLHYTDDTIFFCKVKKEKKKKKSYAKSSL